MRAYPQCSLSCANGLNPGLYFARSPPTITLTCANGLNPGLYCACLLPTFTLTWTPSATPWSFSSLIAGFCFASNGNFLPPKLWRFGSAVGVIGRRITSISSSASLSSTFTAQASSISACAQVYRQAFNDQHSDHASI